MMHNDTVPGAISHPACSGRLLTKTNVNPGSNHPAGLYDWNFESRLSSYYETPEEDDEDDEDEDYDDDDNISGDYKTSQKTGDDEVMETVSSDLYAKLEKPVQPTMPLEDSTGITKPASLCVPLPSSQEQDQSLLPLAVNLGINISQLMDRRKHTIFFAAHLKDLPGEYNTLLTNRVIVLHFALVGLDVLGALETFVPDEKKTRYIEWIYNLQSSLGGFRGSPQMCSSSSLSSSLVPSASPTASCECVYSCDDGSSSINMNEGGKGDMGAYGYSHLASVHSVICSLLTLGDDLSRIDRPSMSRWLASLQQPNGGFAASLIRDEIDLRFTYCACVVASVLDLWEAIDIEKVLAFIESCQTWEGAFALSGKGGEAHGGATYTGVSSLHLIASYLFQKLAHTEDEEQKPILKSYLCRIKTLVGVNSKIIRWLIQNQGDGYRGRVGKDRDCCYSYWLGASNRMLLIDNMTNPENNITFNLQCAGSRGGFAKDPKSKAEILHSYTSVCGLSLALMVGKSESESEKVQKTADLLQEENNAVASNTVSDHGEARYVGVNAPGLRPICPAMGITLKALDTLQKINPQHGLLRQRFINENSSQE